ncbi:hypothetical protein KY289_024172 [Solanum tuberosum]|nr:hypothetical protein KY289_024172 [Solanum tuberosum]
MKISIVSRCWCCEEKAEETMANLFLTAPIATKLWRHFAIFTGIDIEDMHWKQIIMTWWTIDTTPKLVTVYRVMPAIIIWIIWKRRNEIKHGGNVAFMEMEYKPRLYCLGVTWQFPEKDKLKCNTDSACWGNLGKCASVFCVQDEKGDLIYAKARGIRIGTNTEAEVHAIKEALEFYLTLHVQGITMKTYSLTLKRMIEKQWKVPWELIEIIEDIRVKLQLLQGNIIHIFREGNTVADALANEVIEEQNTKEYHYFQDLPASIRK